MENKTEEFLFTKALLKISSALPNLDYLVFYGGIENRFLREFQQFDKWFCESTSAFTDSMMKSNSEAYHAIVYEWNDIFEESILSDEPLEKNLCLLMAKLDSARNDLLQITEIPYCHNMRKRLDTVISRKLISKYMRFEVYDKVVKSLDEMFDEIMG